MDSGALDELLRRATASGAVPGVAASVATPQGIAYEGAFGVRALGQPAPMTPDTVLWMASMTKAITGAAAMQMIEQGRIGLEQPAAELVPALASPQVLEGFDAAGQPRLRPARAAITVRHLLTHTAGFTYSMWNPLMGRYMALTGLPAVSSGKRVALGAPLVFDPGARWEYGIGLDWVGQIVEAVSGQSLGAYLRQHLLEPLGMRDTAFQRTPAMRARQAAIYQRGEEGGLRPSTFALPEEVEFEFGGGGLYGTARDYLAFTRMILGGGTLNGTRVLRPETVALMGQNHLGALRVAEMRAATAITRDSNFWPGLPCTWGLSFLINTAQTPQGRSAGSLAWAGLANTYYWIDPVKQVTGVFCTQILPFFDAQAIGLFRDFESAVYRAL